MFMKQMKKIIFGNIQGLRRQITHKNWESTIYSTYLWTNRKNVFMYVIWVQLDAKRWPCYLSKTGALLFAHRNIHALFYMGQNLLHMLAKAIFYNWLYIKKWAFLTLDWQSKMRLRKDSCTFLGKKAAEIVTNLPIPCSKNDIKMILET